MNRRLTLIISLVSPLLLVGLIRMGLAHSAEAHPATVIIVNSTTDTGGALDCGDGTCELREALAVAAMTAGPDSIVFDLPDYSTITLQLGALPSITEALTIDGSDVVSLTISANNASGIFHIGASAPVTMTNLILRDGSAAYGSAINVEDGSLALLDSQVISNTADYGAIYLVNQSSGLLEQVAMRQNNATYHGGGVYIGSGELVVTSSSFTGNSAEYGASIFNLSGYATVGYSTFSNNSAVGGGGVDNRGVLTVTHSVFRDNDTLVGGGITNAGMLTVTSSTFEGNSGSQEGGGLHSWAGTVFVDDSTFTDNSGRAVYSTNSVMLLSNSVVNHNSGGVENSGGNLTATNTIFSGNSAANDGGAILSSGSFTATNITVSNNNAGDYGGAIYSAGKTTLSLSTLSGNSAGINGGAVYNFVGEVTVVGSTFADNLAADEGGGIYNNHGSEQVTVTDSTFSGNSAASGGGIVNNATLAVSGSTFSGNSSGGPSAMVNYGHLTVGNSTFSGNSSTNSGTIVNSSAVMTLTNSTLTDSTVGQFSAAIDSFGGTTLTLANSILANTVSGADCLVSSGTLVDRGGNLVEDGSCSFPVGGDPILGPLADNGGSTWTHALLPGSPAIDAGNDAICPATDQRDAARPEDGDGDGLAQCDSGAYELSEVIEELTSLYLPILQGD